MQIDFHYYGTYCAALLAGWSPTEALELATADQFTDCCSKTYLKSAGAPAAAATTQLQLEMMDLNTDVFGLQNITRIWASFHFLPRDLFVQKPKHSRIYMNKYRLICGPNGALLPETVRLAKEVGTLQAAGMAAHILADTWAHMYFAGTPSLVINNTDFDFYVIENKDGRETERPVNFNHNPASPDRIEDAYYTNSVFQGSEKSIMNLGHGRAGHLPDYSFLKYRYLPAWNDFNTVVKDNPSDYWHAFCQKVYALQFLHGDVPVFENETYAFETVQPYETQIRAIIEKPQLEACADWKAFGEQLSGTEIPDFDEHAFLREYVAAPEAEKDDTALGRFVIAAMAQKSMVTNRIFKSGNMLAGFSADYNRWGFRGIRDYVKLVEVKRGGQHD